MAKKSVFGDFFAGLADPEGWPKKVRPKKDKPPIKAVLDLEIPAADFTEFVEFVFTYADMEEYLGWAGFRVVASSRSKGLLIVEPDTDAEDVASVTKQAKRAWRAGDPLPEGWHAVTREVCLKAYLQGVKLYGLDWQNSDETDGWTYASILQIALYGQVRFG